MNKRDARSTFLPRDSLAWIYSELDSAEQVTIPFPAVVKANETGNSAENECWAYTKETSNPVADQTNYGWNDWNK